MVNKWEASVRSLKWPYGKISPDAWIGVSPSEWRLVAGEYSPLDILKVCQAPLRVLTKAFHYRKKEGNIICSPARKQEINHFQGRLCRANQTTTSEKIPSNNVEELAADDPQFVDMEPPTCAELLELLQTQVTSNSAGIT